MMMGHFDIGYSGDIRNKGQKYVDAYKSGTQNFSSVQTDNIISEILHHTKDYSTIYMGHIHDHEALTYANRSWNIVGSPQYQVHDMKRLPDYKKLHGYYILDEDNAPVFHESASVPKFVTLYASDVAKGKVQESELKGAIVRRCYDVVLTDEQKTKMDDLVSNAGIYEEDSSVFVLGVSEDGTQQMPQGDEDMGIVLDKFDYIQKQIDKIDHPAVDNSKLSEMMREYYNKVLV